MDRACNAVVDLLVGTSCVSADASVVDLRVGVNVVDPVDASCLLDALVEVVMSRDGLLSIFCGVIVAVFLCSSCPGCSGVEELDSDVVPVDGLLSICVLSVVFLCSSCPGFSVMSKSLSLM